MSNMYKIIGSEAVCNTVPASFNSARVLRVVNKDTVPRTVTTTNNAILLSVTIDTDVTANDEISLTVGSTDRIKTGYLVVSAANTGVVNTNIASNVVSVINSTAFTVNADIVVANGSTTLTVYEANFTLTVLANSEFILEKGSVDLVSSNTTANVLATPIAYKN